MEVCITDYTTVPLSQIYRDRTLEDGTYRHRRIACSTKYSVSFYDKMSPMVHLHLVSYNQDIFLAFKLHDYWF